MLSALILTVYLERNPVDQRRIRFDGVSQLACAFEGQQAAAEWLTENPGWKLAGWRCGR